MEVQEQLIFLARLSGMSPEHARSALDEWLERFQITAYRHKKVEELSKGNQQKVQFLAAILHNPALLIMDEPFSGLDPVNAAALKEAFLEMRQRGKTIIFSTHQLEQVEELCEDMLLINKGQAMVFLNQKAQTVGQVEFLDRAFGRGFIHARGPRQRARRQQAVYGAIFGDEQAGFVFAKERFPFRAGDRRAGLEDFGDASAVFEDFEIHACFGGDGYARGANGE